MASWKNNPIMEWSTDGGTTWIKVTDHGRSELSVDVEPIEAKQRMVNGVMRKYVIAKKRTFSWSWDNIPDKNTSFLAGGTTYGGWIEAFYNSQHAPFLMRLRDGADLTITNPSRTANAALEDNDRLFTVMFSEYSKEVVKRGPAFDLWRISVSLEEV